MFFTDHFSKEKMDFISGKKESNKWNQASDIELYEHVKQDIKYKHIMCGREKRKREMM